MSNQNPLAKKIYKALNEKGANLGNASILIIEKALDQSAIYDMYEALKMCERELIRLKKEMGKPSEERDSFWIATFFKSALGGMECLKKTQQAIAKAEGK